MTRTIFACVFNGTPTWLIRFEYVSMFQPAALYQPTIFVSARAWYGRSLSCWRLRAVQRQCWPIRQSSDRQDLPGAQSCGNPVMLPWPTEDDFFQRYTGASAQWTTLSSPSAFFDRFVNCNRYVPTYHTQGARSLFENIHMMCLYSKTSLF